ncbi:NusB Transcription termination factor [Methylophilaceae bacterium]
MTSSLNDNSKAPLTTLAVGKAAGKKTAVKSTGSKSSSAKSSGSKSSGSRNRRKSRELVLKAVYRGMLNASTASTVYKDMAEDPDYNKADEGYFKSLLESVNAHMAELDAKMADFVDRKISELSPIEHAILRISTCELMFDMSIPYRVVINEGVELAKIYGGIDGHKYINGVLDKLAASVRAAEMRA